MRGGLDERQALAQRLRDEQAVEWIAVVDGRSHTRQAWCALIASQVNPASEILSGRSSGTVSLPSERLIAISQTLAVLTSDSVAGSAIASRAVADSAGSSASHRSSACVSTGCLLLAGRA